jgi:hypothetical protein
LRSNFDDILGEGGYIPYQDKIIAQLLPHSVVNDISSKPAAADVWQCGDNIKTLNALFYN